ncbi:MAG: hypothetical protein WCY89_10880 [Flavobacteriaceae bacterium]
MKYYKYFYWVYLPLAALFIYDGYEKYGQGEPYWISFALGGLAIFIFFFRRKHIRKMEERITKK